jgi:hypothetical protein
MRILKMKLFCQKKGGTNTMTVYSLGVIGAAIYYISKAPAFWSGVLGFLKALIWPVFLVYHALKYLNVQ